MDKVIIKRIACLFGIVFWGLAAIIFVLQPIVDFLSQEREYQHPGQTLVFGLVLIAYSLPTFIKVYKFGMNWHPAEYTKGNNIKTPDGKVVTENIFVDKLADILKPGDEFETDTGKKMRVVGIEDGEIVAEYINNE